MRSDASGRFLVRFEFLPCGPERRDLVVESNAAELDEDGRVTLAPTGELTIHLPDRDEVWDRVPGCRYIVRGGHREVAWELP